MTPTRNTLVGRVIQGGSRRGGRPIGLTRPRYRPFRRRRGSTRQPTRTVVVRTVVAVVCVVAVVVARRGVAGRRPRG